MAKVTLEDIKTWVDEEYNYAIELFDRGDHLVFTNGSAGYHVEIRVGDDKIEIEGERYEEEIEDTCDKSREDFINMMKSNL